MKQSYKESSKLAWALFEKPLHVRNYTISIFHCNTTHGWVYRYEVEYPDGELQEPAEPFPYDSLGECRKAAIEEVLIGVEAGID